MPLMLCIHASCVCAVGRQTGRAPLSQGVHDVGGMRVQHTAAGRWSDNGVTAASHKGGEPFTRGRRRGEGEVVAAGVWVPARCYRCLKNMICI